MNHTPPKLSILLFFLLLIAPNISNDSTTYTAQNKPFETLSKGNTAFAVSLYRKLSKSNGNILFSPYSISTAMAMVYEGARENTAKEMRDVMNFKLNRPELHSAFGKLNQTLMIGASQKGYTLNIANGLCLTKGDVEKTFKLFLESAYDAELFRGDVKVINACVKKKTEGRIEKILEELSPNSVCVILNTIYFKGSWRHPFKKEQTYDGTFNLSSKRKIKTPLMYQKRNFQYLEKKAFRAISMPYKGDDLSMVILLPKAVEGVRTVEKKLTGKRLRKWLMKLDKSYHRKIELHLPKYTIKANWDLIPPLKKLGMKKAFKPKVADFRGMDRKKKLFIKQIKHNTFINVNEFGTQAAGATGVEMTPLSASINPPIFRADHPFFFLIRDNRTGSILFMGRMADPSFGIDS